jgi:hypothetical protein
MKRDEQIMEELRRASEGLLMMSESDYPFEVMAWEGTEESPPEFPREIIDRPADPPISVESLHDFFRPAMTLYQGQREKDRQTADRYRQLLAVLETTLHDLKVYKVGSRDIAVYIVGRAPSGRWLGLSTRVIET